MKNMFLDVKDLHDDEIYLKLDKTVEANIEKGYVPAYYFLICKLSDEIEIGRCDLRIGYNKNIYYGGNVGYEVYESYRGNHYAGKACKLLFKLAQKHCMDYLLITCNPTNKASRKTCEYAGCSLKEIVQLPPDNEMYLAGDREKCVYKIDLIK